MVVKPPSPARHFPVIRVFVSSTFSDLVAERNALAENVWPELERYCRQRGFTFQAIDLRWGVPSEAGLDHRTMQICFEELNRAQETSPEPNFLILLGDKYGWRPLPETISEAEYERLRDHTQSPEEQRTLEDWYRRDANAIPPHHILRARTDSPDGQDYTRVADADGRLNDTDAWLAVQETLWAIVNRAYPGSLLTWRFAGDTDDIPSSVRFQGSATEQEIWHGALQVENAREHVVAWFREIDQTGGKPQPSQLKHFLDLRPDQSPDTDAAAALAALKNQVEQKLAPEPILHAQCRWATDASGAITGEVTTDHLAPMCEVILTRLRALILRQINDYWQADLSAEDATATAAQASAHALDIELRDHRRFAQERGPVDRFVGRDEQVSTLRDYLRATTNRPLIVHGPSGSGKTALLAYVAQQPFPPVTEAGGVTPLILTRFIGAHPESSTLRGLMTSLCRELRNHFPTAEPLPDTLQKLIEEFYAQLSHATAEQPIFVILDALDQLEVADQARECFWLRSQILPQAGESPCHARIIASCLSPSPEFPSESEACEPFRRLQSRGLLADDELGALSEASACELLRRWLADLERGLTETQWQSVHTAVSASSACRHPLYLQVLHEQLRGWREFDDPTPLPVSLPLLIQETLERLCQPNQHGPLPRIALGYLVSARYGLSEGELLEVLFRDSEMQSQLEASGKAYGHRLPPEADHYPIAPWARLRSDLRAYLSERAAPGTTVLSCYHRQVEQAVRTLFLADEATRTERRRLLADYFDGRWDQPDAHALMELPDLLLGLQDHQRLYDRLTNFSFPMRKAEVGLLESIPDDYTRLVKEGPDDLPASLALWLNFFREQAHLLRRGVEDQSVHIILLQLALEHADDSPVTTAAEQWFSTGRYDRLHLQRVPRSQHLTPSSCRAVLEGHTKSVLGAMPLPGDRILSWSGDQTLRLWDAATGACLAVLQGHTGCVREALPLPNDRILSRAEDNTLRVWDAATGACLAVLQGHTTTVRHVLPLPDDRILSWAEDNTPLIWDATNGTCLTVLEGHTKGVEGALPLQDGRILSWSGDQTLRLWDATSGVCLAVLEGHTERVNGALQLPNERILSWSMDNTLRLWDAATGAYLAVLEGHTEWVRDAVPLPDDRILSWSWDSTLRLWDAPTGACLAVLKGHTRVVTDALPLPDGRILSWSGDRFSQDRTLRVWDASTGVCVAVLEGHTERVEGAMPLPDDRILSWAWDHTLRLWDATSGVCLAILDGHTHGVTSALSLPHGRILSWSIMDKAMRLWDASTGACLEVLERHTDSIWGAQSLKDGRILSWSSDKTLRLWDAASRNCHAVLERQTDAVQGVLSLPDGQILSWSGAVNGTGDASLRLWDAATGACLAILLGHTGRVQSALPLPDGRILSWSEDKTLRVWDATTGACLAVLEGHTGLIWGAQLLPDGRILSWSDDKTLRLWDPVTGDCLPILHGHWRTVYGALPLPGDRILSWSEDTTLRVWDIATGVCIYILHGHTYMVTGVMELSDGQILSWSRGARMRVWDVTTGHCLAILQGHDGEVDGALPLPNGQILSWSWDKTLRRWDTSTGVCLAVLKGHTDWIEGVLLLPDGRILSWSRDKTLRLWDAAKGTCLEVIMEDDFQLSHPELFLRKSMFENPSRVSENWRAEAGGHIARLFHRLGFTALPAWQAESDCEACLLQPDGTLVVTQADGQVCILKLHHGNRRVTLAEAEEILRAGGK